MSIVGWLEIQMAIRPRDKDAAPLQVMRFLACASCVSREVNGTGVSVSVCVLLWVAHRGPGV